MRETFAKDGGRLLFCGRACHFKRRGLTEKITAKVGGADFD